MNIKDYIASGILESYAVGLASDSEKAEVEKLRVQYPEIDNELRTIEASLESYAFAHEVTPPEGLENSIWSRIKEDDDESSNIIDFETGQRISSAELQRNEKRFLDNNFLKVAASVALLLSILGNIYLLNKVDSAKETLSLAVNENIQLQKELKSQSALMPKEVDLLMNPDIKMIKLMGQKAAPNATLMLAVDLKTNKVYLMRPNLPMPPKGKQYQLWAIVGNKPIDAGVFDMEMRMQELKKSPMPQTFAVTLENEGGSPTPTSDIYVMGL